MGPNFKKKLYGLIFRERKGEKREGRERERERERCQFVVPFIYALIGLFLYVP